MTMARCTVSMLHMDQRCLQKPLQRKCVDLGATFLITTKQYYQLGIQIVCITVKEIQIMLLLKLQLVRVQSYLTYNKEVVYYRIQGFDLKETLSQDVQFVVYESIGLIVDTISVFNLFSFLSIYILIQMKSINQKVPVMSLSISYFKSYLNTYFVYHETSFVKNDVNLSEKERKMMEGLIHYDVMTNPICTRYMEQKYHEIIKKNLFCAPCNLLDKR